MYSTVTDKFQTTVPKEIREKFKISRNAVLDWVIQDGQIIVKPVNKDILKWAGYFKVGPGDTSKDIREARKLRGEEIVKKWKKSS